MRKLDLLLLQRFKTGYGNKMFTSASMKKNYKKINFTKKVLYFLTIVCQENLIKSDY